MLQDILCQYLFAKGWEICFKTLTKTYSVNFSSYVEFKEILAADSEWVLMSSCNGFSIFKHAKLNL